MQNRRRADNIVPTMIVKVAIGNIVSQNNQQNALPNGLGGVSLQTYDYDAMNRLIRSSGDNFDAGVSYNFQQTYSPSGRIGNKFCDFTHSDHLGSSSWTTDEGYIHVIQMMNININCVEKTS